MMYQKDLETQSGEKLCTMTEYDRDLAGALS
jgi:hypothetical protein